MLNNNEKQAKAYKQEKSNQSHSDKVSEMITKPEGAILCDSEEKWRG